MSNNFGLTGRGFRKLAGIFLFSFLIGIFGQFYFVNYEPYAAETALSDGEKAVLRAQIKPFSDIIDTEYYKKADTSLMIEQTLNEVKKETSFDEVMKLFVSKLNDRYSEYFTKDEMNIFNASMGGEYYGIGVEAGKDEKTGGVIVRRVFEKSPAEKAGLKVNDIIIKVDGQEVYTLELTDATALMKGEKGSEVELTVLRGDEEEKKFTVIRDEVKITSVSGKFNKKTKIGYISVSSFLANTDEAFDEKLSEFEKKGMKGLIIDLRNNGGGAVDSAYNMANRVLEAGKIIFGYEYKSGQREDFPAEDASGEIDKTVKVPIYILINGGSASASELFTGALADNKAAKTVGEKSFGKGVAQSIFTSQDIFGRINGGLKITTFKYYLPKGESINSVGIKPQYKIKNVFDDEGSLVEDKQLKKAEELLKKSIKGDAKRKKGKKN